MKNTKHGKSKNSGKKTGNTMLDNNSKQAFLGLVVVAVVALWSIQGGLPVLVERMIG